MTLLQHDFADRTVERIGVDARVGFASATLQSPIDARETAIGASEAVSEILDAVAAIERMVAGFAAIRFELVEQAQRLAQLAEDVTGTVTPDLARRAFRAELACALLIPEPTADRLCAEARLLSRGLPATLGALREGRLSERHARVLMDHLAPLEDDDREAVERIAIPLAATLTVAKFDRRVRTLRERRAPEQTVERHRTAKAERDVSFEPGRDGMAWLTAHLPAVDAVAIHTRLDVTARALRRSGDSRTLGQLRSDLFCSVLLEEGECAASESSARGGAARGGAAQGGAAQGSSVPVGKPTECPTYRTIRPQVIVTIPAMTLLGRDDASATIEGYGPIDAQTARRLVSDSPTLMRLLTDPVSGGELALDRRRYRVTEELRTWLRVRDGGCRFPGCGRATRACDVDHTHDWALEGRTSHNNLAHLCRSHHTLKHASSWSVKQSAERSGELQWRSPLGATYETAPAFERISASSAWFADPADDEAPPGEIPPGEAPPDEIPPDENWPAPHTKFI